MTCKSDMTDAVRAQCKNEYVVWSNVNQTPYDAALINFADCVVELLAKNDLNSFEDDVSMALKQYDEAMNGVSIHSIIPTVTREHAKALVELMKSDEALCKKWDVVQNVIEGWQMKMPNDFSQIALQGSTKISFQDYGKQIPA